MKLSQYVGLKITLEIVTLEKFVRQKRVGKLRWAKNFPRVHSTVQVSKYFLCVQYEGTYLQVVCVLGNNPA